MVVPLRTSPPASAPQAPRLMYLIPLPTPMLCLPAPSLRTDGGASAHDGALCQPHPVRWLLGLCPLPRLLHVSVCLGWAGCGLPRVVSSRPSRPPPQTMPPPVAPASSPCLRTCPPGTRLPPRLLCEKEDPCHVSWPAPACLVCPTAPSEHEAPCPAPTRSKNEGRWPIPPLASRPYDVTFIGKLEYEAKAEVSGVTLHRQAAVKALSSFRDKWGHQYKVYVPQVGVPQLCRT